MSSRSCFHVRPPNNTVVVLGVSLLLIVDMALFGAIGATVWAIQMLWIPITAAGVINGIGHYWGYRNFESPDASTNIVPWGILIGGEELHNNHHAYGTSAKLSSRWYEFDLGWTYIRILELLGLAQVRKVAPTLRVAPIAKDNGIRLTIENLNTAETNLCTSIAESVEVITAAGPDVYLTADIYHMMRDDDPAAELRKAKGRLIHCHVAEKELRSAPGTKGDDFRPHLRVLREMGYAGAFSFECGWAKSVSPDKAIAAFRQQLGTL